MRSVRSALPVVMAVLAVAVTVSAAGPLTNQGLSSTDVVLEKPGGNVVPPPPDPDLILQGGDTCATATVIGSLPFSADGTTAGYTNDYDEVCPYTGSTSPDVVYSFTPAVDTVVDITLCTGTTNYDTKLYIYEGTCPSAAAPCNDDSCSAPLFPSSYISALAGVALTAGQTYYIVVDGYGGDSGPYTLDVSEWMPPPPPPECTGGPNDLLYYHTVMSPDDSWNAFTSGETPSFDYTAYDNFTSDLYSITDFHWWGLSLFWTGAGWSACDPTGMTFDVTFHDDVAGQPGPAICTFAGLMPTPVLGASYGGYDLYYWEVTGLTPACEPTGAAWVGVHSYPNAAGCNLLWMSGTGGDGNMLQYDAGTTVYTPNPYDLAMCITGTIVPVELQSFDVE